MKIFSIKIQNTSSQNCTNIEQYKYYNVRAILIFHIVNIVVKIKIVVYIIK